MSKEKNGGYFAIIPYDVLHDDNLSSSEKIFYAEITRLSNQEGYCWASNKHFSESHSVKRSTISHWIKNLKENNYIKVEHIREGQQIIQRRIYPITNKKFTLSYDDEGVVKKSEGGGQKIPKRIVNLKNK